MKKKYLLIWLCMVIPIWVLAQVEGITYQAVLVDNNPDEIPGVDVPSNNIPNQELQIRFTIVDSFGNIEYQETQNTQTDAYGTINLTIGEGQATGQGLASFDLVNWDGPKSLQVDIDLGGGSNFTPFSQQPLTYVPYVRHRNLIADGITDLNNDLNVNNERNAWFSGDVIVEQNTRLQRLRVEDDAEFRDRVIIEATMESTVQEDIDSYPLLLTGSSHGMAIQLNQGTPTREHNFMSFWNANNEPIGRIEGFQAISDVSQNFILEVLLDNEPTEDEAKDQEDDDTAPPADAPGAFDIYLNNDYTLNLLLEYMDLLEASATFGTNLGACIGGLAVLGDCDDAVWSAFSLFVQGVQISLTVAYNEINRGTAFESGGADYAEWLKKYDPQETLTYGDVVGLRAGEISTSFLDADQFMVISHNPIVTGAMPLPSEEHLYKRVAFIGQVPVKVLGEVNKGDYILPSGNGDGMAIAVHPEQMRINDYKRIVGIAWDEYHGNELFSFINTAVGTNANDLAREVVQMQALLNKMQDALAQANPNYTPAYFEVETVSVSKNTKTTKSKSLQELVLQQYGIDNSGTTTEKFTQLSSLMYQEDSKSAYFQFAQMPYLQQVLENPTQENLEKYNAFYTQAVERLQTLIIAKTN
ncbi:MAG: hypothetical protein ED555_11175 [Allomuricauda sp.]|nr:MAG: hypothetical protein ED555_11175 [Allomuricauda sp.]